MFPGGVGRRAVGDNSHAALGLYSALAHYQRGRELSRATRRGVTTKCSTAVRPWIRSTSSRAAWALQLVRASGLCPEPAKLNFALGRKIFRADIFEQADGVRVTEAAPANEKAIRPRLARALKLPLFAAPVVS